jgi:gliding motility-associated-like protein
VVNWDNVPGEYTISVYEETAKGCSGNTNKIKVYIQPPPIINLGKFKGICEGEKLTLNPGAGFYKYLWQDSSTQQVFTTYTSGTYWVEVTNQDGCSFRDTIKIFVNPLPKVDLGKDTMLCAPDEITLEAGNNMGASYLWKNGATTPTIIAHEDDSQIWVRVTDENGCIGSDTIQILRCTILQRINIPNAFTPNGDGHNDFWLIGGSENYPDITVKIFDRWGIQVFDAERGYYKPWDGSSNGRKLPTDVYYYIIKLGDGSKEIVGSITLIR